MVHDTVRVKLPREYSGREIVDAFVAGFAFQNPEQYCTTEEFVEQFQYECGSVKQVPRLISAFADNRAFKKRWYFFGKKAWGADGARILLVPLESSKDYNEIEIGFLCYQIQKGGGYWYRIDSDDDRFEPNRLMLQSSLGNFFARIQRQRS